MKRQSRSFRRLSVVRLLSVAAVATLVTLAGPAGHTERRSNVTKPNQPFSRFAQQPQSPQAGSTFCGSGGVQIPTTGNTSGPATPYPYPIIVSGLTGTVSNMNVTVNSYTHVFPQDVDIMLQAPSNGPNLMIMSDVGGQLPPPSPVTITFVDAAAGLVPTAGPLTSGAFQPTNNVAGDAWNPPAPATSAFTTFATAFNGVSPNGTWSVWVQDDGGGDIGSSGQICITILTPTAADGVISGRIIDSGGASVAGTVVNLSGTQNRKTISDADGDYHFDDVETNGFYTVTPSRANFAFSPGGRSFSQVGNQTEAAFTATSTGDSANPLDTPEYFVRQHYLDFLGREPDESGFNFWSDQILECGSDNQCIDRRRENVSAAYFLSIEFQQTGGLVDGLYRASYGVRPQFAEFMPDTRVVARDVVVGRAGWEATLQANKQAFVDAFVQRPAFVTVYGNMSHDAFVDTLISHTGVSFTAAERDALVSGLASGTLTRAAALRSIAENERFAAAKRNEAFVMMQYFGYLRRDPDPDGFAFWLTKLNEFNGNFERAEMVKAFIVSGEYRGRFPR